ncbi:hypothetical protein XELAEV_18033669mg [Xenopus laevis]|uniref:Uncharacterized protein n=1 Tax=Xenopus laevis TaxID=8355 RepID=A0A974CKR8_XENLA|nr:hypothetical protein XELAEV_18033669mg [Xenopus laevis]
MFTFLASVEATSSPFTSSLCCLRKDTIVVFPLVPKRGIFLSSDGNLSLPSSSFHLLYAFPIVSSDRLNAVFILSL